MGKISKEDNIKRKKGKKKMLKEAPGKQQITVFQAVILQTAVDVESSWSLLV